jgi:mannose-6-phosphate isomerase-like protein (cupin superfamily)
MRGLICGLGAAVALAIAVPAFAGDLTSIEVGPGENAIAVKKQPGKLAPIPDIAGRPNKGFNYGLIYQVPPNSIDISKGINVMRGHVDAHGSIAFHVGPEEQTYVLYVISGTGEMTLNDKHGKKYGEIKYKPDDVILFEPHTWHSWVNGDTPFEFLGFDMQGAPKK